jgi:hypothetical protein
MMDVRRAAIGGLLTGALLVGCADVTGSGQPTAPPRTTAPVVTVGPAVAVVRADIARALGERSIVLADAVAPFRPAESVELAAAPRAVYQALLPADPNGGFIVVYEFRDEAAAIAAAKGQHAYLSSGPGRVQNPLGAAHVLRQAGSTVIYYPWFPANARDAGSAVVAETLSGIGVGFDIST